MWTTIQTKRVRISPRQRQLIEAFVRRTFQRELRHISSVVVALSPARIGGEVGFTCRIRIWSHYLGLITATDAGDTLRTAVQQAGLRVRKALRRRLHKRHHSSRRISQRISQRQFAGPKLSRDEAGWREQ